jgi:hypothetical protein
MLAWAAGVARSSARVCGRTRSSSCVRRLTTTVGSRNERRVSQAHTQQCSAGKSAAGSAVMKCWSRSSWQKWMWHAVQHQRIMYAVRAAAYPNTLLLPCPSIAGRSALYTIQHTGSISAMRYLPQCKVAAAARVQTHGVSRVGGRQHSKQ